MNEQIHSQKLSSLPKLSNSQQGVELGFEPWGQDFRAHVPNHWAVLLTPVGGGGYTTSGPFLKAFTPWERLEGEEKNIGETWAV